jgi:hypothetical protein
MKREWIVCERTSRWAAGLRTILARHAIPHQSVHRIVEVRSLAELAARLNERPASIALVEVNDRNLAACLKWLADAQDLSPHACFVALLDESLVSPAESRPEPDAAGHHDIVSVLLEAGTVGVVDSPRHLHRILETAERHWSRNRVDGASSARSRPLVEWAKSLLPWQDG